MRKIIELLVKWHNKNATPEDQIEVKQPITYQARISAKLNVKDLSSEDEGFLNNILAEKKYDLRQQLIRAIHEDGDITYATHLEEKKVTITAKIKVYAGI